MKKTFLFLITLIILIPLITPEGSYADNSVCQITSGPIPELAEYSKKLSTQLNDIQKKPTNSCSNGVTQNASQLLGNIWANIPVFDATASDFIFNTKNAADGQGRTAVMRDAQIFDLNYKKIVQTAENLSNRCALNDENRDILRTLIVENQSLTNTFKLTAIGKAPTTMTNIRSENAEIWNAIIIGYNPQATASCTNNNSLSQATEKIMTSITNIGGGKEKALESWRKAIALIQGGGSSMTPSQYAIEQRKLLEAELSRQGLSQNMKNTLLKNFDCVKSKTSDPQDTKDILSARADCLSNPLLGIDRLFAPWKDFIASSPDTVTYSERNTAYNERKGKTVDIVKMYQQLESLTNLETDDNAMMQKALIDLHISLMTTNELLQERIKPMQKNCMKGNPSIVGGCAS